MSEQAITKTKHKVGLDQLAHLEVLDYAGQEVSQSSPQLLRFVENDLRYDFLWSPKESAKRLFVLFSGNILRNRGNTPPVFQRWSWAPNFPGACLYVSDPVLHLDESLGSGWYSGTSQHEVMPGIVRTARNIASQLGIEDSSIVSYGSSAGGFGALRFTAEIPGSCAITINPQIILENRVSKTRRHYFQHCFSGMKKSEIFEKYSNRFDLRQYVDSFSKSRLIYLQNTVDVEHVDLHFAPFCAAMGVAPEESLYEGDFRRILFEHEGGHAKAETPEAFSAAMQILQET